MESKKPKNWNYKSMMISEVQKLRNDAQVKINKAANEFTNKTGLRIDICLGSDPHGEQYFLVMVEPVL